MYLKSSWLEDVFKKDLPVYQYKHPKIETHKIWAETISEEIK